MSAALLVRKFWPRPVPKRGKIGHFILNRNQKWAWMHEKYVASPGYRHELCFVPARLRQMNVNNVKIPASGTLKAGEFGKAHGAAIIVAHFAFSCTLLATLRH